MIDDNPKVTILIPTFNQAAFIADAVRSALAQTYLNLEVVVGDDASKDETLAVLDRFQDPRLRIVRNEHNVGRVANYRRLLHDHATGDYIVNLDGDDHYTDSQFIAKAVAIFADDPETMIVSGRVLTRTRRGEYLSPMPSFRSLSGLELLRRMPAAEYHLMHLACVYRRRPALELDFYRSSAISSDWESLYRLAVKGRVAFLPDVVGVWQIHSANESQSADLTKHLENLRIWPPVYAEAVRAGMSQLLASLLSARCIAHFALASCVRVSTQDPSTVRRLITSLWESEKLATLLMILRPMGLMRLALCSLGYYRSRSIA
jgi:glycosyltransferase involved in cell wall biosynthesis